MEKVCLLRYIPRIKFVTLRGKFIGMEFIGNLRDRQILRLALPSIVSNVTVPLLGLVDLAIVGHLGSAAYIGAIAVGSMIFNVIYWIFGFLRMGTSGMTSQALGQRDLRGAVQILIRSLVVGGLIAFAFIVCQVPLRWLALTVMHPSTEIAALTSTYFNICIWGAPAMLCLYGLTGWFIGMQNTRIPMLVSIVQNVVNIAASLTLVYGLGMQIEGVALGTLIAQWSGWGFALVLWTKHYVRLSAYVKGLSLRRILSERGGMRRFFAVNRDIFLRTLFLVAVNLFFTAVGARQGDLVLSVNTLLMTMFTLFSYVMDGFAFAGEALSGRYYGARNWEAFADVCRRLMRWGGAVTAVFTVVYALGGNAFLSLLTNEQVVIAAADRYFGWAVLIPVSGALAFILDGIFIGLTFTRLMLSSSLIASVVFFALFFSLFAVLGNHALWLAFIASLLMRGVVLLWYFGRLRRPKESA